MLAGTAARIGMFRHVYLPLIAGVATGFVTAMVSAPIAAFVFGGATGGSSGAIVGALQAMGRSPPRRPRSRACCTTLDKAITFTVVGILLARPPLPAAVPVRAPVPGLRQGPADAGAHPVGRLTR